MQQIKNVILVVFSYILIIFTAPFFVIPIVILMLLPESSRFDSKLLFRLLDLFYKFIIKALLLPVTIVGKENILHEPAIIAANHQSILDIPLVGMVLDGYPQMWFSLTEYAQKPFLGFFLRRLGVPLDMSNAGSAAQGVLKAVRLVKNNDRHTVIFPEGGRYNDGTVHAFLKGFAFIAKITGRPVVPIFLVNAGKVLLPHSFLIRRYPLTIIIGKPFMYHEGESEDAFTERVYAWFAEQARQNRS